MAKYVIEIPDDRIGDFVGNTHLLMPYTMAGHKGHHDTGLEMTPYTEPDEQSVKNNNIHLCWSCQNSSECPAKVKDILFGDDVGNDNICCCNAYRPTESNASDEDEIRQKVEQEVWEFARRIIYPSDCCEDSISKYTEKFLGIPSHKARAIFKDLSYQEVKAKYKKWRKQKDEIRVGDEVELELSEGVKGLVYIVGEEMLEGAYLNCDGLVPFCWSKKDCRKTGKHFDEIEELLKKMKEE